MTIGLALVFLGLVALNRALASRPPSPGWLTCAALSTLPLGYAPFGAISLIQFEAVPSAIFWLGLLVSGALLARAAGRLRSAPPRTVLASGCAIAAFTVMLVVGGLLPGPEAGPTPIVAQNRRLFAAWAAAVGATFALCAAAILAARDTGRRPAMIAPAAITLAGFANLWSL
jgi:hypothetical protein